MRDLLRQRSFAYLTATQSLTVFNDTAFKQVVLLLAIGSTGLGPYPQALAGFVFALPFLLFAVTAGDLADRYSKRSMVIAAKAAEVGVMLLAAGALYLQSLHLTVAALFLMGTQSAFLGPAKYGLLPEIFRDQRLPRANGLFQMTVYVFIILGTASAGDLKTGLGDELWLAGLGFAAVALLGVFLAARIEALPPADPGRRIRFNVFARLAHELEFSSRTRGLLPAMLGHGLFNMVGAALLFAWNETGIQVLKVEEGPWTRGLALITLSMGAGCVLAGRLSRQRLRLDLIPLGGLALAFSFLAVAIGPRDPVFVLVALLIGSFFSGIYVVPLKTLIQSLPQQADKGRTMGTSQMLDWAFILLASGLNAAMGWAGLDPARSFYVLAFIMGAAALGMRRVAQSQATAAAEISAPPPA